MLLLKLTRRCPSIFWVVVTSGNALVARSDAALSRSIQPRACSRFTPQPPVAGQIKACGQVIEHWPMCWRKHILRVSLQKAGPKITKQVPNIYTFFHLFSLGSRELGEVMTQIKFAPQLNGAHGARGASSERAKTGRKLFGVAIGRYGPWQEGVAHEDVFQATRCLHLILTHHLVCCKMSVSFKHVCWKTRPFKGILRVGAKEPLWVESVVCVSERWMPLAWFFF